MGDEGETNMNSDLAEFSTAGGSNDSDFNPNVEPIKLNFQQRAELNEILECALDENELAERASRLISENYALRAEVARLQEELAAHKGTCGDLWEKIARLEKERDHVEHKYDACQQVLAAAEARIRELEEK
jgi:chromosome segregation ATPase